ncbi:MAG: hypothetical protein JSR82_03350 [Verrucomicrobia bacterium]|nr:hypothetical protein [Verrucomicrobiota bacterium]
MKLIWQIVAKDLRSQRSLIWLWVALLASKYVLGCALISRVGTASVLRSGTIAELASSLQDLEFVGAVLAFALVLEDPLVGERVFWRTRPIAGWRLLAAKALGLGLVFLGLPVLVALPWWLICGYGGREVAVASAETMASHAPAVLCAWFFAALSENLLHAVGRSVIALGLLVVGATLGVSLGETGQAPQIVSWAVPRWAPWMVGAGGAAVLIAHQYLRRHRPAAVGFAAVVLVVSTVLAVIRLRPDDSPSEFGRPEVATEAKRVNPDPPPGFRIQSAEAEFLSRSSEGQRSHDGPAVPAEGDLFTQRVLLRLEPSGLAPQAWVEFVLGSLKYTLPDGTVETAWLEALDAAITLRSAIPAELGLAERAPRGEVRTGVRLPGLRKAHGVRPIDAHWRIVFRQRELRSRRFDVQSPVAWHDGEWSARWTRSAEMGRLLLVRHRADLPGGRWAPQPGIRRATAFRLATASGQLGTGDIVSGNVRLGTVRIAWEEARFRPPPPASGPSAEAWAGARLVEFWIEEGPTFSSEGPVTSITASKSPP